MFQVRRAILDDLWLLQWMAERVVALPRISIEFFYHNSDPCVLVYYPWYRGSLDHSISVSSNLVMYDVSVTKEGKWKDKGMPCA
jgi:hypothetical protein